MGQHKAEKLSYQTQLLQQMRQINKERVLQLQTSAKICACITDHPQQADLFHYEVLGILLLMGF